MRATITLILTLSSFLMGNPAAASADPAGAQPDAQRLLSQPWWSIAPPLPPPKDPTIHVSTTGELLQAIDRIPAGGTILLADGTYHLSRRLEIRKDRINLRGQSASRENVILDGGGQGELLALTSCTGVTIADLTVRNVRWNAIKINSETNVQRVTIYNCILHNIWQRAIKGVKVPPEDRERIRPRNFRIQYCLFINDRPKQYADDPADTADTFAGNYIGGIDVMYASNWTISDNVFIGIKGRSGQARGAIFLWHDSRDCVIERNIIIDCDSGICLGNSHNPPDVPVHATRCIVRDNFITRAPENGILADYTRDCQIRGNTVHDPDSRLRRLIRLVHDNEGLIVSGNILSGPPLRNESTDRITIEGNVEGDRTPWFHDPKAGDLRLNELGTRQRKRAVPPPQ